MKKNLFSDLKVLELASVLAGPAVGMFFAELGANVIKVENKRTKGDVTRNWKLPSEDPASTTSAYYKSINWGKKSLFLDLTAQVDMEKFKTLLKETDILLTNLKKDSAPRLGLDYKSVKALNASIIYANLTAFGEESHEPGYDVLLQAETGYLHMTGMPGESPVKMPVALIDILAAHQLKEAILIALMERGASGKGSFITVSLAQSAIAALANQASNYLNEGFIPEKMGSQHPNISPYGDILNTADDKEIILAVGTEEHFRKLCEQIDRKELTTDPRFLTNGDRVINRSELLPLIREAVKSFDLDDLMSRLKQEGVPCGRIRNMKEVFDRREAKEMILEYEDKSRCVSTVAFNIDWG